MAILEQLNPARQQELLDYHQQLLEEQRATNWQHTKQRPSLEFGAACRGRCHDSAMSHSENRGKAVAAFNSAVDSTDADEKLEMLGVAQYHAATANYELNLEIRARLEDLIAGVGSRKKRRASDVGSRKKKTDKGRHSQD